MSSTEVEYSERIQSAQEQTREERICEKVSIRRSRIVGRSFGLVSMISRTKNTCRPTAAGQALLHTGSQDHSVFTIGQKLHHPQGTDFHPAQQLHHLRGPPSQAQLHALLMITSFHHSIKYFTACKARALQSNKKLHHLNRKRASGKPLHPSQDHASPP